METLASSTEFVYGNFDLEIDEDNEIALEMLNTDVEGFNDITNSVFEENKHSDTSCDLNERKEEKMIQC